MVGHPKGAPIDRALALSARLPIPPKVSDRNRDILWAYTARHVLRESLASLAKRYKITPDRVRQIVTTVMRKQGIRSDGALYRGVVVPHDGGARLPYDGRVPDA